MKRSLFFILSLVAACTAHADPVLYRKDTPEATMYLVMDTHGDNVSYSVCGERKRTPQSTRPHCACGDDKDVEYAVATTPGQVSASRRSLQWDAQTAHLQCTQPGCDVCVIFCQLEMNGTYKKVGSSSFQRCESSAFR